MEHFGADEAYPTESAASIIKQLNVQRNNAFIDVDENSFYPLSFFDSLGYKENGGNVDVLLQWMRIVKGPSEIEAMQRISKVAATAFKRLIGRNWAGCSEYEMAAEFQYECMRNGSDMLAYTPVVASGANALILHYIQNKQLMQAGDSVLIDAGACANGYSTDVSRTIPVDGKFTDAHRELYQAVLNVQKRVIEVFN